MQRSFTLNGCTLRIEPNTRRVLYQYSAGGMSFLFDLLSEVGEPYQPTFRRMIESNGLQIELYDNPRDSHAGGYYERIKQDSKGVNNQNGRL